MKGRVWIVVVLVVVLLVAWVTASRRVEGPPLDPRSTTASGTRGLVLLLDAFDADVDVVEGTPRGDGTALLLRDRLTRSQTDDVVEWVEDGGRLVVADALSTLAAPTTRTLSSIARPCTIAALDGLEAPDNQFGRRFEVPEGATSCFSDDGGAFVVAERVGRGVIVSVADNDFLTNDELDERDNAAIAVSLLAPEPGTRVEFLLPGVVAGSGDRSITDLIDTPVRAVFFQLVVAFLFSVAHQARRLGKPVAEPLPVEIEASELTRAVGRLLESNRQPGRAAAIVREEAWRTLARPLGVPVDATEDAVVSIVAQRTSWPPEQVAHALFSPVTTDEQFVAVTRSIARLRNEVLHDHHTATATAAAGTGR